MHTFQTLRIFIGLLFYWNRVKIPQQPIFVRLIVVFMLILTTIEMYDIKWCDTMCCNDCLCLRMCLCRSGPWIGDSKWLCHLNICLWCFHAAIPTTHSRVNKIIYGQFRIRTYDLFQPLPIVVSSNMCVCVYCVGPQFNRNDAHKYRAFHWYDLIAP